MNGANLKSEKLFLREVEIGNLSVKKSGKIVNVLTGHTFTVREGKYKQITFSINGEKHYILAHRLVWISFKGLIEDSLIEVNHKDGVKSNNRLSNLELTTSSENSKHAYAIGLAKAQKGQIHGRSKFTDQSVSAARKKFAKGRYTLTDFAFEYDVSISTMHALLTAKSWNHVVSGSEAKCSRILSDNKRLLNN